MNQFCRYCGHAQDRHDVAAPSTDNWRICYSCPNYSHAFAPETLTNPPISHEEYLEPSNAWGLHRSFPSRRDAYWYIERLPDTEFTEYRLVDHPTRFLIANREANLHARV